MRPNFYNVAGAPCNGGLAQWGDSHSDQVKYTFEGKCINIFMVNTHFEGKNIHILKVNTHFEDRYTHILKVNTHFEGKYTF